MDIEKLKQSYSHSSVVQAICDHMAARQKNQSETQLHRILQHLANDGHDFRKADVIAAFRQLEEAKCGRYVEGRRGWKSRFVWSVKSLLISDAATGSELAEEVEDSDYDNEGAVDLEMVEHTYWLRPDISISIELPADLTNSEANRLSQFVASLSFESEF